MMYIVAQKFVSSLKQCKDHYIMVISFRSQNDRKTCEYMAIESYLLISK